MKVFVTGATGFIGSAVVGELVEAGHQVVGLARSDDAARKLVAAGAQVERGSIEDLAALRKAAEASDGAIHTAFYHAIGHIPVGTRLRVLLGGSPSAIPMRFVAAAVGADRRAIETIGGVFKGTNRPLVATFGTLGMRPGRLAIEDDAFDPTSFAAPRSQSELLLRSLAEQGVRTARVRLPPLVHGAGDRGGLAPQLIAIARKRGESAYVGDGRNRWPAVHRLDAAHLYRLALERGTAGAAYHGVAEEGIPFRDLAEAFGSRLGVPAVAKSPEDVRGFGFLSPFVPVDNPVSSRLTQERLGWNPTHPDLMADLDGAGYFAA